MSATCRMKVDLPAMLGPVTSQRRSPVVDRARRGRTSLGTNRPAAASSPPPRGGRPRSRGRASRRPRGGRSRRGARHRRARSRRPTRRGARRRLAGAPCATARSRTSTAKSSDLAHLRALLGVLELVGEVVELVVGVALAAGDRLLAAPRRRHLGDVRAGHLDVPAEDALVASLRLGICADSRRPASSSTMSRCPSFSASRTSSSARRSPRG